MRILAILTGAIGVAILPAATSAQVLAVPSVGPELPLNVNVVITPWPLRSAPDDTAATLIPYDEPIDVPRRGCLMQSYRVNGRSVRVHRC
jgi:hypothetical protein